MRKLQVFQHNIPQKEERITFLAVITCMDSFIANHFQKLMLQNASGTLIVQRNGISWRTPFKKTIIHNVFVALKVWENKNLAEIFYKRLTLLPGLIYDTKRNS